MRNILLFSLMLMMLLVSIGCSKDKEANSLQLAISEDIPPTQISNHEAMSEQSASPNPPSNQQSSQSDALKALQKAYDTTFTIKSLGYTANLSTEIFIWNPEDVTRKINIYNTTYTDGLMMQTPSIFKAREQIISGADTDIGQDVPKSDVEFIFGNYVGSKEDGLFYKEDQENQWYRFVNIDEVNPFSHIDKLFSLFKSYPEQLLFNEELIKVEEQCCGGEAYEYNEYTFTLDLSKKQFIELLPYLHNNFFGGTYDPAFYDEEIMTIIDQNPRQYKAKMVVNEDYYIDLVEFSFESDLADQVDGEYYTYDFFIDFYAFNYYDDSTFFLPDEAISSAIDYDVVN